MNDCQLIYDRDVLEKDEKRAIIVCTLSPLQSRFGFEDLTDTRYGNKIQI